MINDRIDNYDKLEYTIIIENIGLACILMEAVSNKTH